MLAEYQEIAKQCSSSNATYEQYLQEMAIAEIQKRDSNARPLERGQVSLFWLPRRQGFSGASSWPHC